jgi:hypothetical protein
MRRTASVVVVTVAGLLFVGLSARVASASPIMPMPGFAAPSYYSVGADAVVVADFTPPAWQRRRDLTL